MFPVMFRVMFPMLPVMFPLFPVMFPVMFPMLLVMFPMFPVTSVSGDVFDVSGDVSNGVSCGRVMFPMVFPVAG